MVIPPKLWEVQVLREDWVILSFRCNQLSSCSSAASSCVSQEFKSLWTGDTPEDSTLQDYSRSSQGPPLCWEHPVCSSPLPDAALLCISVKKSFSHPPPLLKKNCGRQLCGRCTWKSSSLTGPEIALVILGSWYINTPALLLLGWDNSEVHALPNFPLSPWD